MFTQRVFARYFQSAFFASLFDLNDASLGTSPSVLLTSWLHLFSPTCLPETPLKKWFPASVDVLIFGTVFFYLSYRVSEIVLWFAASTQIRFGSGPSNWQICQMNHYNMASATKKRCSLTTRQLQLQFRPDEITACICIFMCLDGVVGAGEASWS